MEIKKRVLKQQYWEYLIPALAVISLLISCVIVSSKKFFWNDELLSFYLLNDRSLPHMLAAWSDKFNQAPPLYFIIGWFWDKIFGSTELSLRFLSSVSLGLACVVVWTVLRRTYDFWPTTVGTLGVFCLSKLVLYHNAELRMYGLFTAVCAFGLQQFDTINRRQEYSWRFLFVNSLVHSAIVLTHLYGIFYSGAILVSFIARDLYFRMFRKNVYVSVLGGWIVLIPLAPLLINQSNNSAKWFQFFSLSQFIDMLIPFPGVIWFILALLSISIVLYITEAKIEFEIAYRTKSKFISEISLLVFAVSFMLVPVVAWVITEALKPLLSDRYIIPTISLSWAIFLAYLTSLIIPNFKAVGKPKFFPFNLRTGILSALTVAMLFCPLYYAKNFSYYSEKPGVNDLSYGYADLPIALEAGHDFLPRFYYSSKPSRYFHILDWETALGNVTSVYATGDYVFLNALSRNYPFIHSSHSTEFLQRYSRFLVRYEKDQKWFEARIENNPDYQITPLGLERGANAPLTMFLVERRR
jgi:hypothetical protein